MVDVRTWAEPLGVTRPPIPGEIPRRIPCPMLCRLRYRMRILGHGVDLVENGRIQRMVERHGDRFLARCFTDAEIAYADATPARRIERLAARFAAKEAALKALGTGWRDGIAWTDLSISRNPAGAPSLQVTGEAASIAQRLGITEWWVSMSHVDTYSMGSVIAVGP